MSGRLDSTAIYEAAGVSRAFGGTQALLDADLTCHAGRVHALLGANGAGKSTLVKILAGALQPDAGTLTLDGRTVRFNSAREATDAGVASVSQELNLFPDLTVLENLYLMREPLLGGALTRRGVMRARAIPVLDEVGVAKSLLDRPLRSLSLAARQLVEIARALLQEPRVLILDEPTSALKAAETQRLLDVVKEMRRRDVAIVLVSHFLEDVFQVADSVTVLRSGRVVEHATPRPQLSPESVIRSMLGSGYQDRGGAEVSARSLPIASASKNVGSLVLRGAASRGMVEPVSLQVQPGEVVGLAGLEGSGASETLRMLFGALRVTAGEVRLPTGQGAARSMNAATRGGVAYIPADRKNDGLVLNQSIYENVAMVTAGPLKRAGLLPSKRRAIDRAEQWREPIAIVMRSPKAPVSSLSGGNQQKVVFAKWLEAAPSLVLLDDPTRGVDIGAKADMLNIIRAVADSRRVVLYTSTDMEEMARLCDRVIVFYRRRAIGELSRPLSEHQLLDAVTRGVVVDSAAEAAELRVEHRVETGRN